MGKENVAITDLTMGMSTSGMQEYVDKLRVELLTTSKEKINSVSELENAINAGWQGISRDKFLEDFENARESICDDLTAEYNDLVARLEELRESYFDQDKNLYEIF